jgi:uncharacterized protein (TIGR01777 family)
MGRVVLAGGSGLIGSALARRWRDAGREVVILSRSPAPRAAERVREIGWDGRTRGDWAREIDGAELVVNLAGANLAGARWTPARKRLLRDSRLEPTRALVAAIRAASAPPAAYLQASGVNYYGARGDEIVDETTPRGEGFLADLCVEWEGASAELDALGVRRVLLRNGVVLSLEGGALPRMARPFRLGLGGRLGDGRQWFSWIHLDDVVGAIDFLASHREARGAFDMTAPEPVRNRDFTRALGSALRRPAPWIVPGPALKLLFGELSEVLLAGQRVVPRRLVDAGYVFSYPRPEAALAAIYRRG